MRGYFLHVNELVDARREGPDCAHLLTNMKDDDVSVINHGVNK